MAKRFRFRLETVRRLRKQAQDDCRRAVARRLREVEAVRQRIEAMSAQLSGERVAVRQLVSPGADAEATAGDGSGGGSMVVDLMRRHRTFINYLHQSIADARVKLAGLQKLLREDQAALDEATRQLRVIEKLEEKQRQRHDLAMQRAETAENDEIAVQFARRTSLAAAGAAMVESRR